MKHFIEDIDQCEEFADLLGSNKLGKRCKKSNRAIRLKKVTSDQDTSRSSRVHKVNRCQDRIRCPNPIERLRPLGNS